MRHDTTFTIFFSTALRAGTQYSCTVQLDTYGSRPEGSTQIKQLTLSVRRCSANHTLVVAQHQRSLDEVREGMELIRAEHRLKQREHTPRAFGYSHPRPRQIRTRSDPPDSI